MPEAVVTFDEKTMIIIGCVTGSNGCHEPVLSQAVIDESTLRVTVESTDTSAEDTVCTSVIIDKAIVLLFAPTVASQSE